RQLRLEPARRPAPFRRQRCWPAQRPDRAHLGIPSRRQQIPDRRLRLPRQALAWTGGLLSLRRLRDDETLGPQIRPKQEARGRESTDSRSQCARDVLRGRREWRGLLHDQFAGRERHLLVREEVMLSEVRPCGGLRDRNSTSCHRTDGTYWSML